MAGTLVLLVAVAMLPFVLVIGLALAALRSFLEVKPWLHDEVPTIDTRATADRRATGTAHPGIPATPEPTSGDDVPWPDRGVPSMVPA